LLQLHNELMVHIAMISKMPSQSVWEQDFSIFMQLCQNGCDFLNEKMFFANTQETATF